MAGYRDDLPQAVGLLEEGTKIAKAIDDGLIESGGLMDLGFGRLLMNELEGAREAFEASYALCAKLGNPLLLAYATSKLGLLADAEEALATRFDCTWRRTSCLRPSVIPAGPATRSAARASVRSGWGTTPRLCGSGTPATTRSPRAITAGD
jgi:hypothetical protein